MRISLQRVYKWASEDDRRKFKDLCNALFEEVSPTAYERAKENLLSFVEEREERKYLHSWIEWRHKRRSYIFRAFVPFESAPKMNRAELIHASWVKRDRMKMSLLDAMLHMPTLGTISNFKMLIKHS